MSEFNKIKPIGIGIEIVFNDGNISKEKLKVMEKLVLSYEKDTHFLCSDDEWFEISKIVDDMTLMLSKDEIDLKKIRELGISLKLKMNKIKN